MGINGLLQGLKFCSRQGNIQDYSNQQIAVDASSWLHKSVYSIAEHYVEATEQFPSDRRSVDVSSSYMIKRCEELLTFARVKRIYLVMDGKRSPLKAVTNKERERRRQENLVEARRFKQLGDKSKMYEKYKACIKIRLEFAKAVAQTVIQRFSDCKLQVLWSPYEADAQLVKLCMDGLAQVVITEDSDILAYSAACQIAFPVLYKLDRNSGRCDVISLDWLISPDKNDLKYASKFERNKKTVGLESIVQSFAIYQLRNPGLGCRLFVQACVLSGCDYAPNELCGVGLVTSFKQIHSASHCASEDRFRHALNYLASKARKGLDRIEYEETLAKSEAVFFYHPVMQRNGTTGYLQKVCTTDSNSQAPSLERFQGDLSFLGELIADSTIQLSADDSGSAPVREVVVEFRELPRRGSKKKSYNEKIEDCAKVVNPYKKSLKRKFDTSERSPLKDINLNKDPKTTFVANLFSTKDRKNDARNSSNILGHHLASTDVRFVKRKFSKNGTFSKLESTTNEAKAYSNSERPHGFTTEDSPNFEVGKLDSLVTNHSQPASVDTSKAGRMALMAPKFPICFSDVSTNDDDLAHDNNANVEEINVDVFDRYNHSGGSRSKREDGYVGDIKHRNCFLYGDDPHENVADSIKLHSHRIESCESLQENLIYNSENQCLFSDDLFCSKGYFIRGLSDSHDVLPSSRHEFNEAESNDVSILPNQVCGDFSEGLEYKKNIPRRVTLDYPCPDSSNDPLDVNEPYDCNIQEFNSSCQAISEPFDYCSDFFPSSYSVNDEELEEESTQEPSLPLQLPEKTRHGTIARFQYSAPRAMSRIGPAKTMRFRFGAIDNVFQRQHSTSDLALTPEYNTKKANIRNQMFLNFEKKEK